MTKKNDYLIITIIAVCVSIFSIPILSNINLGISLNVSRFVEIALGLIFLANLAFWIFQIIAKKFPVFLQIAKFAAVGTFNTFLDGAVLNTLIYLTSTSSGIGYAVFKGISFVIANIASYFWNKYWTFAAQNRATVKEFGKFFGVSVIGLLINVGVAFLVVDVIGAPSGISAGRWANVGLLFATLASVVWNFVGYKFFVFISKKEK
jgi:putative flippase GtrA